jgi:hypothetical protein
MTSLSRGQPTDHAAVLDIILQMGGLKGSSDYSFFIGPEHGVSSESKLHRFGYFKNIMASFCDEVFTWGFSER